MKNLENNKTTIRTQFEIALRKGSILITGPSGVGKSKFLDDLDMPKQLKIHMDVYGKRVGDDWLTDFDRVPKGRALIYEGYGSNYIDIGKHTELALIVFIEPEPTLFREIQVNKAMSHLDKEQGSKTTNLTWLKGWLSKAVMTDKEVSSYLQERRNVVRKAYPKVDSTIIQIKQTGKVTKGWH